tara:strand:- start:325 stop:591 length:267 start_codon:yes stop_codon:yes gene_type:complete
MFDLNEGWQNIDNETEEKVHGIARFIRPIIFNFCPISCGSCGEAIATIEDVESMKKEKVCCQCYDMFYYTNKDKWKEGWRPKLKTVDN